MLVANLEMLSFGGWGRSLNECGNYNKVWLPPEIESDYIARFGTKTKLTTLFLEIDHTKVFSVRFVALSKSQKSGHSHRILQFCKTAIISISFPVKCSTVLSTVSLFLSFLFIFNFVYCVDLFVLRLRFLFL